MITAVTETGRVSLDPIVLQLGGEQREWNKVVLFCYVGGGHLHIYVQTDTPFPLYPLPSTSV